MPHKKGYMFGHMGTSHGAYTHTPNRLLSPACLMIYLMDNQANWSVITRSIDLVIQKLFIYMIISLFVPTTKHFSHNNIIIIVYLHSKGCWPWIIPAIHTSLARNICSPLYYGVCNESLAILWTLPTLLRDFFFSPVGEIIACDSLPKLGILRACSPRKIMKYLWSLQLFSLVCWCYIWSLLPNIL